MHLASINMNLLVVLAALLETGSVRDAAARLALSPSATSHALGRLRELFDDPLFVRAGGGLVPTPRAERLRPTLAAWLESSQRLLTPDAPFDPGTLERSFSIATTDFGELLVVRHLSDALARDAPGVDLRSHAASRPAIDRLRSGDFDLGMGVVDPLPPDIHAEVLFHERFVCLMRKGHPALKRKLTAERYAGLDHVLVSPGGTAAGVVDRILEARGLERRVARTVANFWSAPHLLPNSDYVLTVARRVADMLAGPLGLARRTPPVELSGFDVKMVWHRRHEDDPAHRWLRARVRAVVA